MNETPHLRADPYAQIWIEVEPGIERSQRLVKVGRRVKWLVEWRACGTVFATRKAARARLENKSK